MVNHHVHLMSVNFLKQQGTNTFTVHILISMFKIFYSAMLRTSQTAMLILWKNLEKSTVKSCQKDMRIWKLCPKTERAKKEKISLSIKLHVFSQSVRCYR